MHGKEFVHYMENTNKTAVKFGRSENKKTFNFNLSEFIANKEAFSCCYSGIQFYYPKQIVR